MIAPRKKPLYRLPTFTRQSFQTLAFDALVFYLGFLVILSAALTQAVAARYGYDPGLGSALLSGLTDHARLAHLLGLLAAALVLPTLLFRATRAVALVLAAVAYLFLALSRGPLYPPTHLYLWALRAEIHGGPVHPEVVRLPAGVALAAALLGALVVALYLGVQAKGFRERADVHGSARFADTKDVRHAGLLGQGHGLLLGLWHDGRRLRYLRHDGPEHALVFAPTRSGKGVGLVLPNLLTWPHSVLVHDIKSENWALSAGWRASELGSRCLRFDPTDPTVPTDDEESGDAPMPVHGAARYNPLLEVRLGVFEVRDAQTVADILVDPDGDRLRDHWDRTAHALLTALILHVLYAEPNKTLTGCAHLLSDPARPIEDLLNHMLSTAHGSEDDPPWIDPVTAQRTAVHPVVASGARAILDKAPNERTGVVSTAQSFLELYKDPVIARNIAASDFRLDDLMNARQPLSLYLTVPSSDLSRTRPLVRMILNQACRRLTERLEFEGGAPKAHYRHPLLLMLDEFPALGRLPFFAESLAFLAGYGIRCFLVTQDLSQLYRLYGRDESITGNCHLRIAFAPNKPETADLLSKMAGTMTVHQEKRSYKGSRFDLLLDNQYISHAQVQRPLLTPDELMRLPPEDLLLFVSGHPPIRATKIRYYADRRLTGRAALRPPRRDSAERPRSST